MDAAPVDRHDRLPDAVPLAEVPVEERSQLYLLRLLAFLLILGALWWQNRRGVGTD